MVVDERHRSVAWHATPTLAAALMLAAEAIAPLALAPRLGDLGADDLRDIFHLDVGDAHFEAALALSLARPFDANRPAVHYICAWAADGPGTDGHQQCGNAHAIR
jgi:hypothetical protein